MQLEKNFGRESFLGLSFDIFSMEYHIWNIWNPESDIQQHGIVTMMKHNH